MAVTRSAPIEAAEIAHRPFPGEGVATGFSFSPSGRLVSFLDDPAGGLERRLYLLDLEDLTAAPREVTIADATDPEELPLEEQLRRERARELGRGVPSATWASQADVLLVPLASGPLVLAGLPERFEPSPLPVDLPEEVVTPLLSPDGTLLAFVSGGELFVAAVAEDGEVRRLTSGAGDGLTHGLAEFIAQEEMHRREGFWWSPDSASLAYTEVDEQAIPHYRIVHQGSDSPFEEESHPYPFAGGPNATVRVGVVAATGGETTWMDTGDDDSYLAAVHWPKGGTLVVEIESRDQRRLEVVAFDVSTGEGRRLHTETGEPYLNLHQDYRRLETGEWLWSSERTGYRHLELRSPAGELVRVLTSGPWQVDALEEVDEASETVYFTGTKDGATERHLYAVPLGRRVPPPHPRARHASRRRLESGPLLGRPTFRPRLATCGLSPFHLRRAAPLCCTGGPIPASPNSRSSRPSSSRSKPATARRSGPSSTGRPVTDQRRSSCSCTGARTFSSPWTTGR